MIKFYARLLGLLLTIFSATLVAQNFPCVSSQEPATPNLGANLDGVRDWSRTDAFVDLVRQSRGFEGGGGIVPLDANKWPTADFSLGLISFGNNTAHIYNGTYKVEFKGLATIGYCCAVKSIANQVYDAATNTTTADVLVNSIEPSQGDYMILRFTNTRRTPGSATNTGLTDVRVIRPGYPLINTPTFTTPFLDQQRRFSTLRFMDWTNTNNSPIADWAQRTQPYDAWQASDNGVAWEYCIELANTLDKDMWINIPHKATDDYITQLATLLKNTLDPGLNVYVEYSNEIWNNGFGQHQYNAEQAVAEVNAGGSILVNDGNMNQYIYEPRRIGKRLKEISDIFRTVHGAASINTTIRPVFAYQLTWPGQWLLPILSWMNNTYGPPDQYMYATAGAPYFNLFGRENETLTASEVLDQLQLSMEDYFVTAPPNPPFDQHFNWMETGAAAARYYRLKFLCYEGGPDTFGPFSIQSKKDATFDPRMETICTTFLNNWYGYGGASGLFNWYVSGATGYDSQYGTWGLTDDMTNQNTPKIRAIDNVRTAAAPPLLAGVPLSTTTVASVDTRQYANTNDWGGYPYNWNTIDPYRRYLNGGNFDDYLVRVPVAGAYALRVNLNCWRTNTNLRISLNNQVVQSIVVPLTTTPGVDNFTLTEPVVLQMSEGLNTIRLFYEFTGRSYDTKELQFTFMGSCNPLPVELISFEATLDNANNAVLNWKVANEVNCDFYTIEKSTDGIQFYSLKTVYSKNASLTEYTVLDEAPAPGVTYYRLLEKDKSGETSFSDIKSVSIEPLEISTIYPVPAQDVINLNIMSSTNREIIIRVLDVTGKMMQEKSFALTGGENNVRLDLPSLSSSLYVIQVSDINNNVQDSKQINIGK